MSKLLKATEQSVMGLRCDIRQVGSEVVLLHVNLSCLLAWQPSASELCGRKCWIRSEETWTQTIALPRPCPLTLAKSPPFSGPRFPPLSTLQCCQESEMRGYVKNEVWWFMAHADAQWTTALTISWDLNPCYARPTLPSLQLSLYQGAFQCGKLIQDIMSCNPCLCSNLTADLNCVERLDRGQKAQLQAFPLTPVF